MLISVLGKSGSGKSYISNLLKTYFTNVTYIDIDKISHQVLTNEKVKKDLIAYFGNNILTENKINRKKLSSIVFNSEKKMQKLTEITWPSMEKIIDLIIENNPKDVIILDWLLLPKTKYFNRSDLKILVTAPLNIRIKRVLMRDNITKEKFLERDQASPDLSNYQYDYIIENENYSDTKRKVEKIYEQSIISWKF